MAWLASSTSMVPRGVWRLSYLVATARCWRSLQNARSTVLRCLHASLSKAGGQVDPPGRGGAGCGPGEQASGMTVLMPRAAQVSAENAGVGISLAAQDPSGPGPGAAGSPAGNLEPAHDRGEGEGVVALSRAGHRASGRHAESARRWILLVSPPRERPNVSRFLSFVPAPRARRGAQRGGRQPGEVNIGGRCVPRPGRVLVRPHDRRVHGDRPCLARRLVGTQARS